MFVQETHFWLLTLELEGNRSVLLEATIGSNLLQEQISGNRNLQWIVDRVDSLLFSS